MKIGGWKTRSVFERYSIVDEVDLADAMKKEEAREQAAQTAASVPVAQLQYSYTGRKAAQKAVHVAKPAAIN